MKELLLLRHAKSSLTNASLPDHERPLNERGKRAARRIAQLIGEESICPEAIFSSTAVRARRTAEAVAEVCTDAKLVLLDDLYLAGPRAYLDVLKRDAQEFDCVCMVGHNPGMEQLVSRFAGEDIHFVTACLAHFCFDCADWRDIKVQNATLQNIWYPRDLDE